MIPFLVGERVYLRALVEADADGPYPFWLNDAQVCAGNSHHVVPYSQEDARAFIRAANADPTRLVLAICDIDNEYHIGNVALQNIHPVYRSADFAILIGDTRAWGKGYGTEAARLIINHGFRTLNLHRIGCGTYSNNPAMMRLAEKLGMTLESKHRRAVFKDGEYLDVYEYGVLAYEWTPIP